VRSIALSSDQPSVGSNESRNASRTTAHIPHSAPDLHPLPLPPRSCSSPAVALLRFASCSFPPFGFLLISFYVLYLIRVTLYIRPRLQVDPYPFLFGSPASTAFRSASRSVPRPTAVALTVEKGPPREPAPEAVAHPEGRSGSPVGPLHPSVRPFRNPFSFLAPDDRPAPVRRLPT